MSGEAGKNTTRARRAGFTLVELVLSLVVAALTGIATMIVFSAQNRAAESQREHIDAQQNARASLDLLVREVRQAGANVDGFHRQAALVDAAPYQIVFNGDVSSGVGGDPAMESTDGMPRADGSVYSPGAFLDENLEALTRFNNGAETIRLTLDVNGDGNVDTSDEYDVSGRVGDFRLVRQVNNGQVETVAYGLRGPLPRHDGSHPVPLFQYWGRFGGNSRALWGDSNGDGKLSQSETAALTPVTPSELPNVREITITVETLADDAQKTDGQVEASSTMLKTTVRPRNVGINPNDLKACGEVPLPPTNIVAVDTPNDGGRSITLTFTASFDDGGGEADIIEYFVYRRRVGEPSFGAPIYKLPASQSGTYAFINDQSHSVRPDDAPLDGVSYEYFVTAWDCEPQESNPSTIVGPVASMPNGPLPPTITSAFDTPCDAGGDVTIVFTASPTEPADAMFEGYRVYRGTSPGITAYKIRVLEIDPAGTPSYTVHDVGSELIPISADSTYYYVVRAVRSEIESVDSNQWGPILVTDGLAKPLLHTVQDVSGDFGDKLVIGWEASPSEACPYPYDIASYEVLRKSQYETSFFTVHAVTQLNGEGYTWTDSLLSVDTLYEYKIRAWGSTSESVESNVLEGRPTSENQLLPPLNVLAEDVACDPIGALRISWEASPSDDQGDMTHYRIYRGTQPGVYDYELPLVDATGQATYSIIDAEDLSGPMAPVLGVMYHYMVRSHNYYYNIESNDSNESSVLAESTPTAPMLTWIGDTPDDGGRSITVVFDASSHDGQCDASVTTYAIYRGTSPSIINNHVGTVIAMQQPTYTFFDDLVYSMDPPQDNVPYHYALRAFSQELVSQLSNVMGPVESIENQPAINIVFEDDFEADLGWTLGSKAGVNDWQRGTPRGKGSDFGNPDPSTAVSGSNVWGNSLGNNGEAGTYKRNVDIWLISPMIDCQNETGVRLVFKRWLNVERPKRDKAEIAVKTATTGWTKIWRNPAEITDDSWVNFELDLSSDADGQADVQVRFRLKTNASREYTGWNIDDFKLIAD